MKKSLRLVLGLCFSALAATLPLALAQTQPTPKAVAAPLPHKVAVIVVDPAHGGSDTGARGSGGTVESEAVVDFGRAIRVALEAKGFMVVLTRDGNQSPSFDDRSSRVNGRSDAIFVTLHVSSTGTPGTVRAYFCSIPPPAASETQPKASGRGSASTPVHRPTGLLEWERAQEPYEGLSQRLAELLQIQLAQRFQGSPETPTAASIRQLRTVAAPAVAIEVSSVALDMAKLGQMGQPLGEALASAAGTFQQVLSETPAETEKGPAR